MRPLIIATLAAALTGCTITPAQYAIEAGESVCYIGAGRGALDGSVSAGPGGVESGYVAGGVVAINPDLCPEDLRTFGRTPGGSVACKGELEWCESALENQPVEVTPAQLRELVTGE